MSSVVSSVSSSPSSPSARSEILTAFSKNLNIPMEAPGDASKVLGIMERILSEKPLEAIHPALAERALVLQSSLDSSTLQSRMDATAVGALRGEMKGLIEKKIVELKSLVSKEQVELNQKIQKALPEIPPHRIVSFVSTVEGFYGKALSEGKAPKEALNIALGKGFVRSMIKLPSVDEMDANEELQEKIEADPELKAYNCVIAGDLIVSDGVYLREDEVRNPRERYHEEAIKDWISSKGTDPVDRAPRTVADIKIDHKGREFVESKLIVMLYPELAIEPGVSSKIEGLHSKANLLAFGVAYPLIKVKCEEFLSQTQVSRNLVGEVEASVRELLNRFTSLVEGLNLEREEVVPACFPVIEDFLAQAEQKLTEENLEEVKEAFVKKMSAFVTFFHEIALSSISVISKEQALKIGVVAIGKGDSLEEVMKVFVEFVGSITKQEDDIRAAFPGCLLGESEWTTHLGTVARVPLPEGMLDILKGTCPITPDKKVGETHILVLIPETVNGKPLTLNSLGALVKNKGHFPDAEAGYQYMDSNVLIQQGNKPVGVSHYVLMTKDVLSESRNKSYESQQVMITELAERSRAVYEIPTVLSVAAGVLVNYLASGETRLFSDKPMTFTNCQEKVCGYPIIIGGFGPIGLDVFNFSLTHDDYGVAALRKFSR